MSVLCVLGFHKLEKFMGPENVGGGKFEQKYKCTKCEKVVYKKG